MSKALLLVADSISNSKDAKFERAKDALPPKGFIMGFRINTNIAAMNSHTYATMNNRNLDGSLAKLSSGLRINTAADDASGMSIADSLRSQASSLGQAIANGNDGIAILQIADKAMDEQLKILDTVKTKATQAAQDGQSAESRKALQADINRLLEQLDNIANQTSFNGQNLLAGGFTNKEFQVGAYSNQTVRATIGDTTTAKNGSVRYENYQITAAVSNMTLTFSVDGKDIDLAPVNTLMSNETGNGIADLAAVINNSTATTGVRATWDVQVVITEVAAGGDVTSMQINNIGIGTISVAAADSNGALVNAINAVKDKTGVEAFIDKEGSLVLNSLNGRAIVLSGEDMAVKTAEYGRITLSRLDARDIVVTATELTTAEAEATVSLRDAMNNIGSTEAVAMGYLAVTNAGSRSSEIDSGIGAGVTTLTGAMAVMNIAESAQKTLDAIRSDLGSVQNQMIATINNITVTQVNVKAAESNIRDVDFAAESANFSKFNILAQSGSYAMSQANAVQQNVLRLLQ